MTIRQTASRDDRTERLGSLAALLRDGSRTTFDADTVVDAETGVDVPVGASVDDPDVALGQEGPGRRRRGSADNAEPSRLVDRPLGDNSPISGWTAGRALAARGVTVLLWAAIACGPIALIANGLATPLMPSDPAATPVVTTDDRVTRAAALAVTVVGAWLTATTDDPGPLVTLLPGAVVESVRPTAYRDLTVAATAGPDAAGYVAVTVGCLVDELGPAPDGGAGAAGVAAPSEPPRRWTARHFQVTVATEGGAAVVAEPAAVALPDAPAQVDDTSVQLHASDEAAMAVALFLSAYLTSSPDLERFVAPDAVITPLTNAPYVTVDVRVVRATERPALPPATGDRLDVRASAAALTPAESTHTLTYWLTLHARDGRWEVAGIAPGPPVAPTPPSP